MFERFKKRVGFPYSKKLERAFKDYHAQLLFMPLLALLGAVLIFSAILVMIDLHSPHLMALPDYIPVLLLLHLSFFCFTLIVFIFCIGFKKQLLANSSFYFITVNIYAVGICIWGSTLAAYIDYPSVIFTAYGYITFILAIVLVLKPWQAFVLFTSNCLYYMSLLLFVFPPIEDASDIMANAIMATIFGIIIASIIYNLRAKSFYHRVKLEEQHRKTSEINVQLRERVHIDGLTGLRNRRFYDEVLPERIEELKLSQNMVCGMMFDIDNFKGYNDHYGHQAGDSCLCTVATLVDGVLSAKDTYLVRYGGEEFFVLAAVPERRSAERLAERMRATVENAQIEHLATERGIVTISIGAALMRDDDDLESLTEYADKAVYRAKKQGRNRVAFSY